MKNANVSFIGSGEIVALNKWLKEVGVTPVTAWRWRKAGWLPTLNINGRVYLSRTAIAEFTRRARAGEFSKHHATPSTQAAQSVAA